MNHIIGTVLQQAATNAPAPEDTYLGSDGLLHCSKCGEAVQVVVRSMGITLKPFCLCKCKKAERDAEDATAKREKVDRVRLRCFQDPQMCNWTFAADDRANPRLSDAFARYAERFADFKKIGKGLLLYGSVGTGKSFYAACIANAVIDRGYIAKMVSVSSLFGHIQAFKNGSVGFIDELNDCSLLILDDLGAERQTSTAQELVYSVVDRRCSSNLPLIVTTNLSSEEIKKTTDETHNRIYDRLFKLCHPIEVGGESRRRQSMRESYADIKTMLGL